MDKVFFDITFKKNTSCSSAEQFISNYFRHVYCYLLYLKPGYEVHSFNNAVFNDTGIREGIHWNFLNLNSAQNLIRLAKLVNRHNKAVVFIHGFVSPFHLFFFRLFLKKNIKLIVQHHAEKPFTNKIKRRVQQLAYSGADAYLFAARKLADVYVDYGIITNANKIHEVMEASTLFRAFDKTISRKKTGVNGDPVFLWVGRLDENKNPLLVINAFKRYKDAGNAFRLYMAYGTMELEDQVKQGIIDHGLTGSVIMLGKVPHEELQTWYSVADYFIAASYYEGSGVALCEAMACGCIPLVTNIASFSKMTGNGRCGILFEPGSVDSLFEKLIALDHLDKATLREQVITQFQNDLSFEAIGNRIKDLASRLSGQ